MGHTVIAIDSARRAAIEQRFTVLEHGDRGRCSACGRSARFGSVCHRCCGHAAIVRGWIPKGNGTRQAFRKCWDCGASTGDNLGPLKCGEWLFDVLLKPLPESDQQCERCGAPEIECHHWAPQNTFEDADSWPIGLLCRTCHHEWHARMDGYRWNAVRAAQ